MWLRSGFVMTVVLKPCCNGHRPLEKINRCQSFNFLAVFNVASKPPLNCIFIPFKYISQSSRHKISHYTSLLHNGASPLFLRMQWWSLLINRNLINKFLLGPIHSGEFFLLTQQNVYLLVLLVHIKFNIWMWSTHMYFREIYKVFVFPLNAILGIYVCIYQGCLYFIMCLWDKYFTNCYETFISKLQD